MVVSWVAVLYWGLLISFANLFCSGCLLVFGWGSVDCVRMVFLVGSGTKGFCN